MEECEHKNLIDVNAGINSEGVYIENYYCPDCGKHFQEREDDYD